MISACSRLTEVRDALLAWGEPATAAVLDDAIREISAIYDANLALIEALEQVREIAREATC